MQTAFSYKNAFSRNIGWVTQAEQGLLQRKRVAIAGMGGVGGMHLLTLARLGIAAFHITDFDTFAIEKFNRQVGATVLTIGMPKVDVLAAMVRNINPQVDVRIFPHGADESNLSEFLTGVDLDVDGLDFFAFVAREATFVACASHGTPAVTATAPRGLHSGAYRNRFVRTLRPAGSSSLLQRVRRMTARRRLTKQLASPRG